MIDYTATDAAAVNKNYVDTVLGTKLQDQVFEPIRADAANHDRQNRSRIPTAARIDHAAVITEPGHIDAHDQRIVRQRLDISDHGRLDEVSRNKLQGARSRKLAADSRHEEVGIFGVILCPVGDLLLI